MSLKVKVCLLLALAYLADANSSSEGKDSSDSSDDANNCQSNAGKLKDIYKQIIGIIQLPTCTCGVISSVRIYNGNGKKYTTFQFCTGCTGTEVPVASSSSCSNFPGLFSSVFPGLCSALFPNCQETVTFYECSCPTTTTTTTTTTSTTTPGTPVFPFG